MQLIYVFFVFLFQLKARKMKTYHKVLAIAGTDSGGGAGIPADIKTISACGCYAECVITAVTVQNTLGVSGVHDIPADVIENQARAVLSDMGADAIKIGMLSETATVKAVAKVIRETEHKIPSVLDTVMVSTSGHPLLKPEAITALREELMPEVQIITPNIPEAEVLLGKKVTSADQLPDCARELSKIAGNSVLLKSGHIENSDELTDVFYNADNGRISRYPGRKIESRNTHGTGCTMSSAMASFLAMGATMEEAVSEAKKYLQKAIEAGADYQIGNGHGPVKHFWNFW